MRRVGRAFCLLTSASVFPQDNNKTIIPGMVKLSKPFVLNNSAIVAAMDKPTISIDSRE